MNHHCRCGGRLFTERYVTRREKVPDDFNGLWWRRRVAIFRCSDCYAIYEQRLRMPDDTPKFIP